MSGLTRTFLSNAESGDAARVAVARLRSAHHAPSLLTMMQDIFFKLREAQLQLLDVPAYCKSVSKPKFISH